MYFLLYFGELYVCVYKHEKLKHFTQVLYRQHQVLTNLTTTNNQNE
jgi:hypothetical protein